MRASPLDAAPPLSFPGPQTPHPPLSSYFPPTPAPPPITSAPLALRLHPQARPLRIHAVFPASLIQTSYWWAGRWGREAESARPARRLLCGLCPGALGRTLGTQEFQVPDEVLGLIYAQTVVWVGSFFCPLLPLLNTAKFLLLFYLKKVSAEGFWILGEGPGLLDPERDGVWRIGSWMWRKGLGI